MLSTGSSNDNSNRLIIDREKFPISVEADNPFIASQEFDLLTGKQKALIDSPQVFGTGLKRDEEIAKINRRMIRASESRLGRIPDNIALIDNLGISYLNSGDFENAIKCFKKSLAIDPHSFQTLANIAKAYLASGDIGEALKIYLCIEENDHSNIKVLNNIANILLRTKEYARAKVYLDRALKLDPKNLAALSNSAMVLLLENQTNKAINVYRRALSVKPDSSGVLNNIGVCFAVQKNFAKAIRHFLAAHALKKRDQGIIVNLARCYYAKGEFDESVRTLENYLKNGQDSLIVRETLAWMNFLRKDYRSSLNHLTTALKMVESEPRKEDENRSQILNNMALVYQTQGDYEAAEKYYLLCLNKAPLSLPLLLPLCNAINLYFNWDKDEIAKALIDRGLTDFPGNPCIREALGRYYFEIQDYKTAHEILSEVMSIDPKVIDAYAVLSVIEMEITKDYEKARKILEDGLAHHPKNGALLNNLAYNYLLQNDTERARVILDSIQDRDETFVTVATRGLLLIKEDNIQEGQRLYNLAKSISSQKFRRYPSLIDQKRNLEVAKYYQRKGNSEEAVRLLRKVLSVKAKYNYYSHEARQLLTNLQDQQLE